jgi:hypothetical protein
LNYEGHFCCRYFEVAVLSYEFVINLTYNKKDQFYEKKKRMLNNICKQRLNAIKFLKLANTFNISHKIFYMKTVVSNVILRKYDLSKQGICKMRRI